jgi:Spy/CpxP family protein refolding chaperone
MMYWKSVFMTATMFCSAIAWSGERPAPYVGQETREIKALSAEEIRGYLAGDGMALAKAAELNHYPGPRHVLDMADKLQVSDDQRARSHTLFDSMNAEAKKLGAELIEKERLLDSRFAAANISDAELRRLIAEIAALQGRLRTAHLNAHLAQRALLTPEQIDRYDALRGYQDAALDQHRDH